jgi:hypothetical protein
MRKFVVEGSIIVKRHIIAMGMMRMIGENFNLDFRYEHPAPLSWWLPSMSGVSSDATGKGS